MKVERHLTDAETEIITDIADHIAKTVMETVARMGKSAPPHLIDFVTVLTSAKIVSFTETYVEVLKRTKPQLIPIYEGSLEICRKHDRKVMDKGFAEQVFKMGRG